MDRSQHLDEGKYLIVNDPGYWGAADPRVLVLGMSKGQTQANAIVTAYHDGTFDQVAYQGFRSRLLRVIQEMGLMSGDKSIDRHLQADETEWGFASVLRCSLTAHDKNGTYSAKSSAVIQGMKTAARPFIISCIDEHLRPLSRRTKLVILLGNDNNYFTAIESTMAEIFSDYAKHPKLGPVVFRAGSRFYVHVAHPSRGNGWFEPFFSQPSNLQQGQKREEARQGISGALGNEILSL